jgi:hypothetical protein
VITDGDEEGEDVFAWLDSDEDDDEGFDEDADAQSSVKTLALKMTLKTMKTKMNRISTGGSGAR